MSWAAATATPPPAIPVAQDQPASPYFDPTQKSDRDYLNMWDFAQSIGGVKNGEVTGWAQTASQYGKDFYDFAQSIGGVNSKGGLTGWVKDIAPYGSDAYYAAAAAGGVNKNGSLTDFGKKYAQQFVQNQYINAQSPLAQQQQEFNPDAFLNNYQQGQMGQGQMQGQMQGQQQGTNWLGFENTPIGQLYGTEYRQSPGYQFQLDEANKAARQALAAQGLSGSGAELKELQRIGQGMASQDYGNWQANLANQFNNYLGGLQGMSASGQNAAVNLGSAAMNYGSTAGNLALGSGMTQAQNTTNMGNMFGQGVSNIATAYGYGQGSQPPPTTVNNPYSSAEWMGY